MPGVSPRWQEARRFLRLASGAGIVNQDAPACGLARAPRNMTRRPGCYNARPWRAAPEGSVGSWRALKIGAGDEIRTHDPDLGNFRGADFFRFIPVSFSVKNITTTMYWRVARFCAVSGGFGLPATRWLPRERLCICV